MLRRIMRWLDRRNRATSSTEASLLQWLHDNPNPDFTSERARRYHGDNSVGR